ncbi:carbohydrate ABC transporter permease [Humibacter ginsenosidimutans]|uniref:Sugar ABC transporter permease n=1 Tax=Humibacter ginsenosidimutans TaxID=2599293 RepID=A0A5B8M731_9MICO|nr:sugar ABC transporter permease [Humibacter ginsenosidimutans]QDZ16196.1 sugar ABC transporter permease [Humibacter ginsenosidimutans]
MTTTNVAAPARKGGPQLGERRRKGVYRRTMARLGWGFSAPALIFIAAVTIFPILFSVVMSFSNVNVLGSGFQIDGFTLDNYGVVFSNATWQYALVFTVGYTVVTVLVEIVLGTLIALVLERLGAARGWMMAMLLIPWSLITVISATLWDYIYDPLAGVATQIISALGFGHPVILGSPVSAIIAMMVADIWKTTPFVAIIVLAGLVMLPGDVYEAAELDGANGWKTFWQVTLPLLRPTIALAVLFRVLQAFGVFDLPFVLTQGGPQDATTSLAILGYRAMFTDLKFGPGAAVATTTAALVVLGCLLFLRVFRSQVSETEL